MTIAVDFDGTCVKHRYPMVGEDVDGAVSVLKELVRKGHKIILYTMRSGDTLDDAISWFIDNDIELWGINRNPEQYGWSSSPKVFANLYIDDAALGIPLIEPEDDRDYVELNGMIGFPFEEGVLTSLEHERLNVAFSIIRGVVQDSVESSIELGFNAERRCTFGVCRKPAIEGSEYCREHKEYMEERQCQR